MGRGLVQYGTQKVCIKDFENTLNKKEKKGNLQNFKSLNDSLKHEEAEQTVLL